MRHKDILLGIDIEETEVYERLGKSDVFRVALTQEEAINLKLEIEKQLENND
jgi:hypothetical protein